MTEINLTAVNHSLLHKQHLTDDSKAQKIGRFIADKEVTVKECDSMIPLKRRTAGGFMSPLKSC